MKYLRKYNEDVDDNIEAEISDTIDDICIDLVDMGFEIYNNFKDINMKKIEISKNRNSYLFFNSTKYNDIVEVANTIIRIGKYLGKVGFRVRNVKYATMLENSIPMSINSFVNYIKSDNDAVQFIRKIIISIDKI